MLTGARSLEIHTLASVGSEEISMRKKTDPLQETDLLQGTLKSTEETLLLSEQTQQRIMIELQSIWLPQCMAFLQEQL